MESKTKRPVEIPLIHEMVKDCFGGSPSNDPTALTRRCMYGIYLYLVMVIEARISFDSAPHVAGACENLPKELSRLKEL